MSTQTTKSEYLVICRGWEAYASKSLSPEELQNALKQFYAWFERLRDEGKMKSGHQLAPEGGLRDTVELFHRQGRVLMLIHHLCRRAVEWRLPGQHLPKRHAKRVQVRADVNANPRELFGTGKLGCPGKGSRHRN